MPVPLRRLAASSLVLLSVLVAGCGSDGGAEERSAALDAQSINPFAERSLFADPDSKAAQAAGTATEGDPERERVLTRLAETPQGIWITPERYPAGEVAGFVTSIVDGAQEAEAVPTFVVYGIPDRDCSGGYSAGGLTAETYLPWVEEIADAIVAAGGSDPVAAVLEPDALASLEECGDGQERMRLIAEAAGLLVAAEVTTYLDGGHSHWLEPDRMAALLAEAGVADVRGFATNVSNFQAQEDEERYAAELSGLLDGAHYVIDTGRNGFGAGSEWCNPDGRAFGVEPRAVTDRGGLDAYLWVKPPGESDGTCNGGPAAGDFWADRAVELAIASGW